MGAVLAPAMVSLGGAEFAVGADGSLATAWLLSASPALAGSARSLRSRRSAPSFSETGRKRKRGPAAFMAGVVQELTVSAPRLRDARG